MIHVQKVLIKIKQSWDIHSHRQVIIGFILLVAISLTYQMSTVDPKNEPAESFIADTVIPAGQVLHPIKLENVESIAALIDKFGVIDLYSGTQLDQGAKKIASKVKLLRAPLNPNEFALLVNQDISELIMKSRGPFWGVIHNRSLKNSSDENSANTATKKRSPTVQIEYYKETL